MKLRVFTAFSGYDSQCLALERLKQNFPDSDYELAGNSIVVDVLYHLFRKMFCETENEQQQMTLF
jgi:hypothetical protein